MPKAEKETIFRWDSEEKIVHVFTCHRPVRRKAERAGYKPLHVNTRNGREVTWEYRVPLSCFGYRFRPVDRPRRPAPKTAFRSKKRGKVSQK